MFTASFLAEQFSRGLPYEPYLQTGTDEQRRRWQQVYDAARLTPPQRELLGGFVRQMRILVVSGIWCGDCVQQVPLIQRIAEGNREKIDLRIIDRDAAPQLRDGVPINAGHRVPAVLLLAEDFEFCALAGDRTLARYRALARKQLGAACPTGLGAPDADELAATLADWLAELERVQLMLRLSARLRQRHGD